LRGLKLTTEPKQTTTTTVDRIMSAAIEVFCEKGYNGASIREIMTKAEVTQPVIYYHFGSKKELYKALVVQSMDMFFEDMQNALINVEHPLERLRIVVQQHFRFQRFQHKHRTLSKFLFGAFFGFPRVVESVHLLEMGYRIVRGVQYELEAMQKQELIQPGDAELMAVSFMGAFQMLKIRNIYEEDFPLTDELADWTISNFIGGVVTPEALIKLKSITPWFENDGKKNKAN
jgi:AcrR family transcriptional regulator